MSDYSADYNRTFRSRLTNHPWVSRVTIILEQVPCACCAALQGSYAPQELPSLPAVGCTSPAGCTCRYALVVPGSGV